MPMHQIMIGEGDQRAVECAKEINNILKKYNCAIEPITTITSEGVLAFVDIVPIEKRQNKVN